MTDGPPVDRPAERAPGRTVHRPDLAPLRDDAEAVLPGILEIRRRLHRRPEIGLRLPETQALVAAELEALGLRPVLGHAVSSVTATIEGSLPGPTVLLRADMDGLPLREDTGLEFASEIDGAMHACGHDTHVAMLLGAAQLLVKRYELFAGRVLLMFQPGEEGYHGARHMLEEGLLEAGVDAAFAIHIGTRYPSGTLNYRAGSIYASSDTLRITVRGRGGHASAPHSALDPITVAAEIVLGLQTMVTRRVDAFDPAVVTIARVTSGTTTNVIPETALLEGTIRTVSDATRGLVHEEVRRLAEGIASAHGASARVEIVAGYPLTVNDRAFTGLVVEAAREIARAEDVRELDAPIMGAEDFSYVLQRVPGAMVFLGARPAGQDPATAPMNHSNVVVFDEAALATGIALHAAVALRFLEGATGA